MDDVCSRWNYCAIEPENFEETFKEDACMNAMQEEIYAIEKNETWELVEKPNDKEVIGVTR